MAMLTLVRNIESRGTETNEVAAKGSARGRLEQASNMLSGSYEINGQCQKQLLQLKRTQRLRAPSTYPMPERTQRSPHASHLEKKVEVFAAEGCTKSSSHQVS